MANSKSLPTTSNYRKHITKNPLKRVFINNYHNTLISLVAPLSAKRVLDAGCGEGFILKILYEHKIGKSLEGIDNSHEAIKIGKQLHPFLNMKMGSIYSLRYKDNQFDAVLCTEVLEHLDDPKKALKELERVSSRYIFITVPHEPWWTLFNFTQWGKDIGHINHWSGRGIEKFIVENSKLKIIKKVFAFPWTMILAEKSSR